MMPANANTQTPRWWLISMLVALVAMASVICVFFLPDRYWWVLGLMFVGLIVFALTYRLHPANWYRRRAELAFTIASAATLSLGFQFYFQWGTDTVATLVVNTSWFAIIPPWLIAAWFGYLDFLSRHTKPSATSSTQQTSIAGGIHAKTVHVHIQQSTSLPESSNEHSSNAESQKIPPTFPKGGNGLAPHPIAPTRLSHYAKKLIGRSQELRRLTQALNNDKTHIISIIAWGGVGKTSLVHEWMANLAQKNWPNIDCYFDWSFYSQGVREQGAASADNFIAEALRHFGDPDPQAGSPHDRGERLARLAAEKPTVLILDGLEPLQYPPGPTQGEFKDPAVRALLRGLAQREFAGLCVLTSREPVADLKGFHSKTVNEWTLEHLSDKAGAELLHRAGARQAGAANIKADDEELQQASREVKGHALTLQLLGGYLKLAYQGDIRQRDKLDLHTADAEVQGRHTFKVMAAYENWFQHGDAGNRRQWTILRLLGLFDRPADFGCLQALREPPAIPGLTEGLQDLSDDEWNIAVSYLQELGLLSRDSESLEAHPLIREHFAQQLQEQRPEVWRTGHKRLYEYLCKSTAYRPDTLTGLQPLYQAVVHGCSAGLQQQAYTEVYIDRISRRDKAFVVTELGAFGADLGAITCFFENPWRCVSSNLSEDNQAWLLHQLAYHLRALGRLPEALAPLQTSLAMRIKQKNWREAANSANNLSELKLTLGDVTKAVENAEQAVKFADCSGHTFSRMAFRTAQADALYEAGQFSKARKFFKTAEKMQAKRELQRPLLYSLQGFHYCKYLLYEAETAAWQVMLNSTRTPGSIEICQSVAKRAEHTLAIAQQHGWLLAIALDYLTLGCCAFYLTLLGSRSHFRTQISVAGKQFRRAVDYSRQAGEREIVALSLLSRAWLRVVDGDENGARTDLDEAWDIAERGSMKLHMADVLLHRARLFRNRDDLAKAKKLVQECGYHRRDIEITDAEAAARGW